MEQLNFNAEIADEILNYYIENKIGQSEKCLECRVFASKKGQPIENGPIPFFHIGKDFNNSEKRVLFLGIVAYGWEGELMNTFFNVDPQVRFKNKELVTSLIEDRVDDLFFHKQKFKPEKKMSYFSYLKFTTKILFGDDGYSKIAISNLLKCNSGSIRSNGYAQKSFDYCIRPEHVGNLIKEIEIIKPTHVVIMSGNNRIFNRYIGLIERMGVKTFMIAHPSSSKSGKMNAWAKAVQDFVMID